MPPISTFRSVFRAYWVNWRGAVAWTICRHIPRGNRTRTPSMSAPACGKQPKRLGVAAELDADLLEDRVGVLLDERQALLAEDLERRELAGQERDVLGVGGQPERLARRPAAAAPSRRVVHQASSLGRSRPPRRRRRSLRASATPAAEVGVARSGKVDDGRQVREGGGLVGEGHRLDEVLLEARLDGGLDLLDASDDALDLASARRPTGAR